MWLQPIDFENLIQLDKLFSMYFFYFAKGHIFPGETHASWELVYVNSGALLVTAGTTQGIHLKEGQAILHPPEEFHRFEVIEENTSIFVTSFASQSAALTGIGDPIAGCSSRYTAIGHNEKRLLSLLCQEGEQCFGKNLDSANITQLQVSADSPIGSLQLIRLYLEQLLILLLRTESLTSPLNTRRKYITQEQDSDTLLIQITEFMDEHLDGTLDFHQIQSKFGLCPTSLKNYFSTQVHMGVMEYYQRRRINEARRLLRDGKMNITEIADHLGYPSIHSFSRQFKRLMNMSPSEYLRSIHYTPL